MIISKKEFIEALELKGVLNERRIAVLKAIYESPGHKASAKVISDKINKDIHFVNLIFGSLAKSIAKYFKLERNTDKFNSTDWWPVIADGKKEADGFNWKLKKNFIDALLEFGVFSDKFIFPDEANISELKSVEGALKKILVNAYERNKGAREKCIKAYGAICQVCDIDFEKIYGHIGKGFIHVHHLAKISKKGGQKYIIDPVKDLRPVCPNCHAMIHRKEEPYTIEELREIIQSRFQLPTVSEE